MALPKIDTTCLIEFLVRLLNTPSPTGYSEQAIDLVEKELSVHAPLEIWRTRKGALVARWQVPGSPAPRALTAHVDTLGAMVKEIKPNGRLLGVHVARRQAARVVARRHGFRARARRQSN